MKKYIVAVMCLLLLVAAAIPALAVEETKISLSADKTVVKRGDTITFTVSISGDVPFSTTMVKLNFDSDYFEFVESKAELNLNGFSAVVYGQPNVTDVSVGMLMLSGSAGTYTGPIQTITFRIKETAPVDKNIEVTGTNPQAQNAGEAVTVTFEGITIGINCDHSYPETWTMTGDGTKHQRVCSKCNTPQVEDHIWPDEGAVNPIPSCTTGGKETFKCADCEATKVEDVDPLGHAWDNACDTTCNRGCGETRTIVHNYSSSYKSDGTNHWKECSICHDKKNVEAHTPGAEATELAAQICTVCKRELQAALPHEHNFSTEWEYDAESHYHRCLNETIKCYVKQDEDLHDFDNECDIDCNTCGYVRVAPHKYNPSWQGSEEGHWRVCVICEQKSDIVPHVPGPEATMEAPQICEDCHFVIEVSLSHVHNYGDAWYHDENQHWQTCSECKKSNTHADHTWDEGVVEEEATSAAPGSKKFTCSVCAAEKTEEIPATTDPTQKPTESTGATNPVEQPTGSGRFPWQIAGIAAVVLMIAGVVLLVIEIVRSRKTNMHGKFSK